MSKIKELPKSSSRLLTSSQIIASVISVVKELVENALDSGAKNIEVKLENYGLDKIEIKDNGCGVNKNDIQVVAKPHFTSKLTSVSDLDFLSSYGFRGEALGAVCAVSELVLATKSAEDNIGSVTNFDKSGQVLSTKPCPCPQGTTVSVLNVFKNIPVRRQYYRLDKNKKDELRKIEELLLAYGIIQHDVRFVLFHDKNLIWQKTALLNAKDALIQTLGNAVYEYMKYIDFQDEKSQRKIELFLPRPMAPLTCSFTSSSRCIVAVNRRPVRIKAIDKLLKDAYNKSIQNVGRAKYPICYVSFTLPSVEVDVNVEPNKTAVLFHHPEEILTQLSELLKKFYLPEEENLTLDKEVSTTVDSILNQNKKSNEDFLTTLKTSCDQKIQSKLPYLNNSQSFQKDSPMCKKDVTVFGEKAEPSKKRFKHNSQSSKDLNHHLNTIKNFFDDTSSQSSRNNMPQHASPVTVHRIPSQGGFSQGGRDSAAGQLKITSSTVGDNNNNFSAQTNEPKIISANQFSLSDINSPHNSIFTVPACKKSSDPESSNLGPEMNSFVSNQTSVTNYDSEQNRLSNVVNDKSVFHEKCILGMSRTSTEDHPNKDKDTISVPQPSGTENTFTSSRDPSVNNKIPAPENSVANNSVPIADCNDSSFNNNKDNKATGQNGVLWSRGVLASGEVVQPVTIVQPKTVTGTESESKGSPNSRPKRKSLEQQVSSAFERKLNAFDIFCRNNRLEVASLNPEFNNQQIAQLLTKTWNNLTVEEKAVYNNLIEKEYPKNIKKKERLGKTVSENLSQDRKNVVPVKRPKKKIKTKSRSKTIIFSLEKIKSIVPSQRNEIPSENLNIINYVAPGIWICGRGNKLYLLNTFRLQETIIYYRLLETFQFEAEPLETPVLIPESHLCENAVEFLSGLQSDFEGNVCNQCLVANGFNIKLCKGENNQMHIKLLGLSKYSAFYGVSDLKELLILMMNKSNSPKLSECRPAKVLLYLQSEANRMCRRTPAIQQLRDVEDLLLQKDTVIPNINECIHHKAFFHEVHNIKRSEESNL